MKIFTILYFIVLGAGLGATVYAGAVVAPVTFNTDVLFGSQVLTYFSFFIALSKSLSNNWS